MAEVGVYRPEEGNGKTIADCVVSALRIQGIKPSSESDRLNRQVACIPGVPSVAPEEVSEQVRRDCGVVLGVAGNSEDLSGDGVRCDNGSQVNKRDDRWTI